MTRVIERRIVGALLVSNDRHVLLGYKRPHGGRRADCWVLPGGGVKEGENDSEALKREVYEETGIDTSAYATTLIDSTLTGESRITDPFTGDPVVVKLRFFDYLIVIPQNAQDIPFTPADDLADAAWILFEELATYKLSPSARELLQKHGFLE